MAWQLCPLMTSGKQTERAEGLGSRSTHQKTPPVTHFPHLSPTFSAHSVENSSLKKDVSAMTKFSWGDISYPKLHHHTEVFQCLEKTQFIVKTE